MFPLFIILSVSTLGTTGDKELTRIQEFITGNNLFTGLIYKEVLKENEENFLVSPFSVETVLALTQSGAKDETAAEMRSTLHLPDSTQETESVYTSLLPSLKGKEDYSLETANKIYVQNNYPLNETFKKVASEVYQSDLESIDFSQKVDAAENINQWVEKQTNNKIHNLIDPKNLHENTRVILINALYFKGKWTTPFERFSTRPRDFYKTAKDAVKVDTMHNSDLYNYYESPELDAKFLELPYEGDDISMVCVLPNSKEGLSNLENQIEKIFAVPNFTQERVSVSLPKFTIESKIQLKTILQNLGINKAFSEEADLSGIAGNKGDLYISDVIQKAFINVTETGTEAAAATAVIGVDRIGFIEPAITYEFNADHPFIFYISFKEIVLFAGRVSSP